MDSSRQAESCGIAAAVRRSEEPRQYGTRQGVLRTAVTPASAPRAELVDAQGFLASLVWHLVRLRERATREGRPRIDSPYPSKASTGLIGVPDVDRSPSQISAPPEMTAHPPPLVSFPRPIETLLSQLARRRLSSLAPREGF